jgi:hypothetical protein
VNSAAESKGLWPVASKGFLTGLAAQPAASGVAVTGYCGFRERHRNRESLWPTRHTRHSSHAASSPFSPMPKVEPLASGGRSSIPRVRNRPSKSVGDLPPLLNPCLPDSFWERLDDIQFRRSLAATNSENWGDPPFFLDLTVVAH